MATTQTDTANKLELTAPDPVPIVAPKQAEIGFFRIISDAKVAKISVVDADCRVHG